MDAIWKTVGLISSGLTLAAFMIAVGAWVYKARLDHRENVLKNTPAARRGEAALEVLEASRIDPANLSQKQRFDIALLELKAKTARFRTTAIIISFIGALGFALAIYAIGRPPSAPAATPPPPPPSAKDMQLANSVLGTWRSGGKLPAGTGWRVRDMQYTLAVNGWAEWRGTFEFGGASYPILMSGDWRIGDGSLLWTVRHSNVAMIPPGHHGVTPIVDVTETALNFRDPNNDGALTADLRVR